MAALSLGFLVLLGLHSTFWELAVSLFVLGAGMSLCMVSMINVVVESCPQSEFGVASGMNTLFRIVGGSIGPVLAAVILAANSALYQVGPSTFINLPTENGYMQTWWVGLGFALVGLAAALVLRPRAEDKCAIPQADLPPSEH
jgi:MFS family permease